MIQEEIEKNINKFFVLIRNKDKVIQENGAIKLANYVIFLFNFYLIAF